MSAIEIVSPDTHMHRGRVSKPGFCVHMASKLFFELEAELFLKLERATALDHKGSPVSQSLFQHVSLHSYHVLCRY